MHYLTSKTFRITLLIGVLLSCFAVQAQLAKPFLPRYTTSLKGDIVMIGNNIVNRSTNNRTPNDPYDGDTANDDYTMRYIDIDGDNSTFSSSKANLTIPGISCSKVVYAALYWSTTYRYENSSGSTTRLPVNQVKLKVPGASAYQAINGEIIYDGFNGMFTANGAYACYADVTSYISNLTNPNGEYTVADIRATQGTVSGGGVSGGWSLFVVFENSSFSGKHITSFDGFAGVDASVGSLDINYSGFVTVPAPLTVKAKLAAAALEGDRQINGDQLLFRGGATGTFYNLSNSKNPSNNFFNSSVSALDASNVPIDYTDRTPDSGNTLGYDSDIISINQGYLPNSATSATVRLTSTQDRYYMFFNALCVDIIEPDIQLVKTVFKGAANVAGQNVMLGDVLRYVISFKNVSTTDHAKDFTIKDILPVNTSLQSIDMSNVPGGSWVQNPTTKEITFSIPDALVKKGTESIERQIVLNVKVASTCNELTDACANRIENTAYATYKGVENTNQISNDPSIAGVTGTCNAPILGPANFIVDVSNCTYSRTEVICNGMLQLRAGDGYGTYSWFLKNPSGDIPMGTTQQITVTAPGNYYVINTPIAPCLAGLTENIEVKLWGDMSAISPVEAVADEVAICPNNGTRMSNIFLCGINDSRLIPSNIATGVVTWEKLNTASCNDTTLPANCPNNACAAVNWQSVATGANFTVNTAGQYRLSIDQDGTGSCRTFYYFNVYKNNLDPQTAVKDIVCTTAGEIRVLNVPNTYQIRLINQSNNAVLVDYPNTNPVFAITTAGLYRVELKQTGVANGCTFILKDILVLEKDLTVNLIPADRTCAAQGSIRVQALNVNAQYYYTLTGPISLTHGPVTENNYVFDNLNQGTYTVTVTTDDNCTFTGTTVINNYSTPLLTASVAQNISCDPGTIQLTPSGGLAPYVYAIYSKNGVLQNPGVGDFTLDNPYTVEAIDAGTYVFVAKDANGCTVNSNPVTITNLPGATYTTSAQNVSCNGAANGTFTFNVTANNGYAVSYEIADSTGTLIAQNTTGIFTGLAPGDYIASLIQTGTTNTCSFPTSFTITQPAALAGTAGITQNYTCATGGATITVNVPSVTGGTSPYQYSINGTTFGTTTTFTGLTAGTYRVTIKDAKGCTVQTTAMTVAPLTPVTSITFSASAVTCPSQTSNVTVTAVGGVGPFNYQIIAPTTVNNGTSNIFNNLAPNAYTFRVTDSNGCTLDRTYTINAITPIAVTGTNNSNVACFGTATGSLTYTVTGFGAGYNYSVVSTGTAVPAATGVTSGTISLTNLAAGSYTITVTNTATNCIATAAVTINAPSAALAFTKTVTQPTCNAQGKVVINATGGWGSNQYQLTTGATVLTNNNGTFNGLMPGSYTIKVTDGNGCAVTDTFILTGAVAPVLTINPSSDLCYDTINQASLTALIASGTGTAPFTYKLNNGPAQTSATFTGLNAGTYTISVIDGNSCTASVTKTIFPQLAASATLTKNLDCSASRDAIITVNIAGGETGYEYQVSFNGGAYNAATAVTGNSFTYTIAENDFGTYQFQVTDTAGCIVQTVTTTVNELHPPRIVSLVPTDVTCNGGSNGSIAVNLDPDPIYGLPPFTYAVYRANNGTPYGSQLTGLPAGHYFVTIYDSKGCQAVDVVDINEPAAITFTTAETNIRCVVDAVDPSNTISAGEILVQAVAGGEGPYTYELTNNFGYSDTFGPSTNTSYAFVILNYGIYQVVIRDANGCTAVKPNIIMASPPNELDVVVDTSTPSTCADGGTAVVTVGAIVSGVNYKFGILETNTPPYTPTYVGPDDVAFPRTATFTHLVPGVTYTFVVYDMDTRCYYFTEKKIDDVTPTNLVSNILTANDVTCKGANDGNVIFNYSGFAPGAGVTYQVYRAQSNTVVTGVQGATASPSGTVTDTLGPLAPGVYYIQFEEVGGVSAGCQIGSDQFTIAESPNLLIASASVTKNDNSCTLNAGQIVATAQDGATPYTYQVVADGASVPTTWVLTNSFNREGGAYDVYVKDANNCIKKIDVTVPTDSTPDMLPLTVQPPCAVAEGQSDIYISTVPGGIEPMTFSVNGGSFQQIPGRIIYGLSSGNYTIVMKDANGCTDTESVTIYAPLNIAPLAATQPTCVNTDGVIRVAGSGGSAPVNYRYELQTAAGVSLVTLNTTGSFPNLAAGDYKVILTDTDTPSCSKELLITLEAPIPVTFTTTQTNVSCNTGTDGIITATLATGNTDYVYTYGLTDGTITLNQNNGLFTGLAAGTYTVTVTSGKNCAETATVTITAPAAITVSASATDFACATDNTVNTAVITITATGGTGTKLYSIDGTAYYASNTFDVVNTGADQNFTVHVKDANNCEETAIVTVNRLPAITAVAVSQATEITCTNDETVTLTVTGGSGDFTFELLPTGTQPAQTPGAGVYAANFDLPSTGDYTFIVTDNGTGCSFTTATYTIAPFDTLDAEAVSATDITCFGAANGTITINVTGYTGSFDYEVVDAANTVIVPVRTATASGAPFVVTNVPAGSYFVKVTANGTPFCTEDTSFITVPGPAAPLALTATPNASVACTNDKGEITANATGGWGTYEYQLVNNTTSATVAYSANNVFTGLSAGSYAVSVRDAGGCIVTQTVTFTQPANITADISASAASVLCYGAATASVEAINVVGGQGTYQYILNTYDAAGTTIVSSTGAQASPLFTSLGAGKYSISVVDGYGCGISPTGIVTIVQPAQLVASLTVTTGATCLSNATLTLSATGGTPGYQYSTDGITYNGTNTFTVPAGTYQYYIKDANNCTAAISNAITVLPVVPVTIDVNIAGAKINCADETTAVIINAAQGGLGNYQYELLDSANGNANVAGPQADGTFAGLGAGSYIVRVTSGDCNAMSSVINIANPDQLVVTPTVIPLLCFGDPSGKIIINTSGGTGAVQYAISPNLDQFDNNNEFDNLAAGWYDIIVQDQNGCFEFLHLEVTQPNPIVASIVILTNETCLGEGDGTVEVSITGGTGSYAYSLDYDANTGVGTWANFTTQPYIINGIAPGQITINIKDQNNCFLNPPIDREILPGVDLQPTAAVSTNCVNNAPNNDVTVGINAGVDPANMTYSLDGTTYVANNVFTNVSLAPGTYLAYAKHTVPASGLECIKTASFTIDAHDPIVATAAVSQQVLCFGQSTGEITVTATGGTAPLEFAIATAQATPVFGTYQTTNVFTGLAAGNYVISVKDDITCELITAAVTITEPATAVSATITHTDEVCINANDGTITITPTGGTSPYETSLNGSAFITDLSYTALADGTYTVDVRDNNGCLIIQQSVTIAPGVFINGAAEVVPNCTNNVIGNVVFMSVDASVTSNVTYALDGGAYQPSEVFTDVPAGSHNVSILHTNGCEQVVPFTVDPLTPITASETHTDVLCNGLATAQIIVTATGGTGTLSYAISNATPPVFGTYDASNVFTGLAAGTYTVSIMDDNLGCETQLTVTITQPAAALAATLAHTDETCFDSNNGSITITITGGTAPYQTAINGGTFTTATSYTALADGSYTIDVTDVNGCAVAQLTQVILNGVDMQPSAAVTPNCVANTPNNDVVITIATGFAAGDVTYSIDGTTYQATNTFNNVGLMPGTYTAYVQHINGCIQTTPFTIDLHTPIAATAAVTANVLCFGGTTGEITVTATGGTTPLQYAISPAYVYGTSNVFTGLAAGTYDVKVKDAISCEITTTSVTITQPAAALAATLAHTDETCFDSNNGSITITITGGTAPYQTSLNGAAFVTATAYSALADGSYTIDVSDANGCAIAQLTQVILNGVDMQPSAAVTPNCVANTPNNDVVITIATGFAAGDVTYSIDGTTYQATNTFNNVGLTPGTYTAYVQHTNGCIQTTPFTIDLHTPIAATAAVTTNVLCFGGTTGEITVAATGGTTPLQYAISPAYVYGTTNIFTGLAAGTYDVKVKDAISCEITTTSITITQPAAALAATLVHTDETCFDSNNGSITITITGGTAPYQTSLNGGTFTTATSYTALADGSYTIDVKDGNGCAVTQLTQVILNGVDMQPSAAVTPNCVANTPNNNVVITIATGFASGDVTYSIDGTTYQATNTFNNVNLAPGTYTAYVQHINGCIQTTPFTIDLHTPIAATAAVTANVLCFGGTTGEITVTATGGTTQLQFAISPAYVYGTANIFTGLAAGTYDVKVKDAISCEITTTSVTITQPAAALAATLAHTDETCFDSNNGSITITITGGTAPYQTSLNGAAFVTATAYSALADGSYTIDVTDGNGCAIAQLTQVIQNGVDMQPSAAVTPNCVANTPNNDVIITIATGFAAGDVTYSIDGTTYQATNTFNNVGLTPGTYTAYVQHTNGCIQTTPFTIDLHTPIAATAAVTANVLCFGGTTGEITVTATGGTTSLQYAISPAYVYGTANIFTGLAAGTYDVKVKDAISCEITTTSVTITQPATAVTATVAHTDEVCINANDGTITITPSGGAAPYQTSLNGAAFVTATAYSALADGTYTIDVSDANGCAIAQQSVTIAPGVFINASAEVVPNCTNNVIGNVVFMSVDASVTSAVTYSLDGGAYQVSEVFADVPVGSHNVSVLHTNGCVQIVPFTIVPQTPITATYTQTDVLCNGAATGQVVVVANGGTGALTYSISSATPPVFAAYQASNTFSGLTAGTYTISVLDDNLGCEVQLPVTIAQPATAITATLAHTDETCFDSNNGSITITISGGTAPYQTSLNGGTFTTATSYTALADGSYTIDVKDGNGCAITQLTQVILNGVNMQPVATVTPNCINNAPNNDVVITVASGITLANVTYSIDGTNYQVSNTFTNVGLAAGTYTAYAQYTNGCIQTAPFTINVQTAITASSAVTANVLCNGSATGEITVTASGGSAPLQYAIAPATGTPVFGAYQASNVFTGLAAGSYVVNVKDAITCDVTTTAVTITQPATALAATASHTDETCFDSNNGTITVSITGGTTPYQTSLNGGAYTAATVYSALADGTYTIDVKDGNRCMVAQLTQVVQNGVNMQPSAVVTPNCVNNTPNNDVVISVASGITLSDVTYSINGTNYQASNTFANVGLTPGTYTAYAKHTNGCIQTVPFIIGVHVPLMHTGTLTLNITCYGNNMGEATLSVAGGTGTLQYAMAPAYVYQTSNTFTGLAPGTYDFKVKDAIGCEIQINGVTITEPTGPLAATLNHTDETCFNSNNGTITVNITGGSPPYFTSLDGAAYIQGQTVYTNLADGTHTINVTDAFACTIPQQSVVIVNGVNMQPVATVTPNCVNNAPDNNVSIAVAAGITLADVTYSIDGTNYQASNTFANVGLAAGVYTAYVQHANSCIQQTTFTIAPHAPVTATVAAITGVSCFNNNTGQITVTASGGTSPLVYAIANENTNPLVFSAYQSSNIFTGLAAGFYTISVKDIIGCEVVLSGNQVNGPTAALTAVATPTHESCTSNDDGRIDLAVTGGTAPYATSLNGAQFVVGQLSYTDLDGGNYTVNVQDANGCQLAAPLAVTINEGVSLNASVNITQVCEHVEAVVTVNPTATGTVTYTLDGLYTQTSNVFNSDVTPMAAGPHTITVTHSAGCSQPLIFTVAPRVQILVNYSKTDVACRDNDTGVIVVNPSGGTAPFQYGIAFDLQPAPVYSANNTFDQLLGDKDYTLYVKDALGCVETATVRVTQPATKLVLVSAVATPETCVLAKNGRIDINVTGGTAPYSTALNSPTPNNFLPVTSYNNLYGGTYDVYVMDANGCVVKTQVVVEGGVNIDPYVETVMSCDNNVPVNMATVKLRHVLTDVTYSLNPTGPFTANNVFELPSGQHTVYIRHKNGCQKSFSFTVQDRQPVTAQVTPVAAKCNGEANGTITVRATGGTGALKYAIANGSVTPVTFGAFQTANVFTGLAASNDYIIRVEDNYGCFTEVNGIIVNQPDAIVLTTPIIIQEEICVSDGDAAIELEVPTGGTAPYATSLNATGPFVIDQYLFDNLDGGTTYTVYVQDANGCVATTSVTLAAPMNINAKAQVDYDCDKNTVTVYTDGTIPAGQLSYTLTGTTGIRTTQGINVFEQLDNGTYTVEVVNTVTGCSDVTDQFVIQNAQKVALSASVTGLNQITANATGGVGNYRYTFEGNDNGTKNTYTYSRSGTIEVTVTDSRNCSETVLINVVFVDIVVPDVITPDGNGQNDTWSPGNTQNYPNINTDIFDRYGRKLTTLRQGQEWDGKYDGNEMPTGDYWYLIKLGDADNREFVGHFTIYR